MGRDRGPFAHLWSDLMKGVVGGMVEDDRVEKIMLFGTSAPTEEVQEMVSIELARALLRRKELQEKVDMLRHIKDDQLHETVMQRRQINETVDDIAAKVPKVSINEVTRAYDWHARQLREVDAAIQKANWETIIQIPNEAVTEFVTEED